MQRYAGVIVLTLSVLILASCGGGSMGAAPASNAMQLKSGNWVLDGTTATGSRSPVHLGMGVAQTSSSPSLNLVPLGPCLPSAPPPVITTSMNGNTLTIKAVLGSATLDATLTGSPSQLTGTYSISGGCADGDHGSMTATNVPPITGTWTGPLQGLLGVPSGVQVAISPVQSGTSLFGIYTITGSAQLAGTNCMTAATIGGGTPQGSNPVPPVSIVAADSVSMNLNSGSQSVALAGLLDPPGYDKTMHLYVMNSTCADMVSPQGVVLTKQ